MLGLGGSTWSSAHSMHSMHNSSSSLASLALTSAAGNSCSMFQEGTLRRTSSPSGQQQQLLQGHSSLPCAPTATNPRSPFHAAPGRGATAAAGAAGAFGSATMQQQPLSLGRSGSAGQTSTQPPSLTGLTLNLPAELGLGDCCGSAATIADEEVLRVHTLAAARQQQQQAQQQRVTGQHTVQPLSIRTAVPGLQQHGSGSPAGVGGSSPSLPNFAGLMSSYGSAADDAGSPLAGSAAAAAAQGGLCTEGSGGWPVAGGSAAAGGGSSSSRFATPSSLGLVPPPPPPPLTDRQGLSGVCCLRVAGRAGVCVYACLGTLLTC